MDEHAGSPGSGGHLPDDDLAGRLAEALRAQAGRVTPPAGAWESLTARLAADAPAHATGPETPAPETPDPRTSDPRTPDPRTPAARAPGPGVPAPETPEPEIPCRGTAARGIASRRRHAGRRSGADPGRWRIPLIAAAAVAAIALATAVIVTRGPGSVAGPGPVVGPGPVGGPDDGCAEPGGWSSSASVPIDASFGQDLAGGTTAARTVPGSTRPSVQMFFADSAQSTRILCGRFQFPGGIIAGGGPRGSDGTSLGYLALSAGDAGGTSGARYLWGAVGPDVEQVQLQAVVPPDRSSIDPGFNTGPMWTIDSGAGTPWSSPDATTTVWTNLGNGWHGLAVQLPADATTVYAAALDRTGKFVQYRTIDLSTGTISDGPLPQGTTPPPRPGTGAGYSSAVPPTGISSESPAPTPSQSSTGTSTPG